LEQGTAYKSVIKNAAYIFLIKLFPAIAFFAITILYSRELPREPYGDYQNFWVKLLLLGTLAYAGLPVTIITYSAGVIKNLYGQLRAKHLAIYLFWLTGWCVLFSYLLYTGLQLSVLLSLGLLVMYVVHAVQEALLMASKRMKALVVLNFVYALYFLFIHLQALDDYQLETLLTYLLAGMVVRGVLLAMVIYLIYQRVKPEALQDAARSKVRNLWLHLGAYDLMQNIFRFMDKFILSVLLSAGLYALYYNGAFEIPLLPYLLGAVSSSVLVQLAGRDKELRDNSHVLMYESGKLLACIVFPLFFFLLFFSRELFIMVFTEKYLQSVPIFIVMLFLLPLRAYNYTTLLQHHHKGAIINKGALLDLLLALSLMYPIYKALGLPGIALSFVISTYIQVGYYLHHTSKTTAVPVVQLLPFKNWLIKLLLFGGMLFLLKCFLTEGLGQRMVLGLGATAGMLLCIVSFLLELRSHKHE
jgi:O-antigen/teichoic acid export membrane protein